MAERYGGFDHGVVAPAARLWSLPAALAHLAVFVSDHAGQAGKSAALHVDCPPVLMPQAVIDALIPTLVQLLRNAVEHGVETPARRLVAGKPLTAALTIRATVEGAATSIAVEDDGAGIAAAAMADLARDAEGDDLRARRGSGLRRAATRIATIGGRIGYRTRRGEGTAFVVTLPLGGDAFVVPTGAGQLALTTLTADPRGG